MLHTESVINSEYKLIASVLGFTPIISAGFQSAMLLKYVVSP